MPDADKAIKVQAEAKRKGTNDVLKDVDTQFGVGGEHSNFTLVGRNRKGEKVWLYEDEQILNPQWKAASWLKETFGIDSKSKTGKIIDWFGKRDLKTLLGLENDINYKQYLYEQPDGTVIAVPEMWVPKKFKESGKKITSFDEYDD